jgi:hypothetical protein
MHYTLQTDGDGIEKRLYAPLIQPRFPNYEVFWQKFVVPLTNRPTNVQLKTDTDLAVIGKGDHDLCLAQLHYSVLRHLGRAYQLRQDANYGLDHLVFSLSAIVGAQDVAFELLERFQNPTSYGPWLGKRSGRIDGGREAQSAWKNNNGSPLQDIRNYRNHLVHGRTPPGFGRQYPMIGRESVYFDWRKVTAAGTLPTADFASATNIHDSAFDQTVTYFESKWASDLLPNI